MSASTIDDAIGALEMIADDLVMVDPAVPDDLEALAERLRVVIKELKGET